MILACRRSSVGDATWRCGLASPDTSRKPDRRQVRWPPNCPMNEIVHLVHVATLAGKPIEYDPQACKIINAPEANALLHREYRAGWTL